jgi:hypothetical protein
MTDLPLKDYRELPPMVRSVLEKLRSNAFIAALHQCGGEIILTQEVMDAIRGHIVVIRKTESGDFSFKIQRKQ